MNDLLYQVNKFFISSELSGSMASKKDQQILKAFGENLKRLREEKGLTTRQFADLAEIAYSQVWTIESGKGNPSLTTLLAIARTLNVSLDFLVLQEKKIV